MRTGARIWAGALLLILILALPGPATADSGGGIDPAVTDQQISDQVSRYTGLDRELIDAVLAAQPKLKPSFRDQVLFLRLLDRLNLAPDSEAAGRVLAWAARNLAEAAVTRLLPALVGNALSAFKDYQEALQLVRDYLVLPGLDDRMYRNYRRSRLADFNRGEGAGSEAVRESIQTAYDLASNSGGFYPLRAKMIDSLIRNQGYHPDSLSPGEKKKFEARIDRYWSARLEARFQKEVLQLFRDRIVKESWPKRCGRELAYLAKVKNTGLRIAVIDRQTGASLSGATVVLTGPRGSPKPLTLRRTTPGDGLVRFKPLPPGEYLIRADRSGYRPGQGTKRAELGRYRLDIVAKLASEVTTGSMRLVIVDAETNRPISARTTVTGPDGRSLGRQGSDIRFDPLQPGPYRISVAAPGYQPVSGNRPVEAGKETELTVSLAAIPPQKPKPEPKPPKKKPEQPQKQPQKPPKTPKKGLTDEELLAQFRALYPDWVQFNASPNCPTKVTANAVPVGGGRYHLASKGHCDLKDGRKSFHSYDRDFTIGELESLLRTMKKRLKK